MLQQHFHLDWRNNHSNKLICDNEGLLIWIEKTIDWMYLQPNITLWSEWDIESVIIDTHRAIGWKFAFEHIHSHQDDSIATVDLPLEVQLNVEADQLATAFLDSSQYQGRASLFPSAKCQLLINDNTVSHKLPNAIQYQAGIGPLKTYLKARNNWSDETLESISWTAHGSAHLYHQAHHSFFLKFCHRHLPLGKTLHHRDGKYPARCPGCHSKLESHDHFLGCQAPARIKWRTALITNISRELDKTKTDTNLKEAIINVLDQALAGRPVLVNGPFETPLRAQERIGLRSLFQGY
jgi:hypothetical protein